MAERKLKLKIAYDGTDYHGWAKQPDKKTIQSELELAFFKLTNQQIRVHGASRTDAGVHALAQQAACEIDSPIPTENFAKALSDRLPHDIVVTEVVEVPAAFDVISDVTGKLYQYTIKTTPFRPVLDIRTCWHLPITLDHDAMNRAASMLVGKHDFKSFASAADKRESSVRTIFRCEVTSRDEWIFLDVEGDGFLYNMVRNIAGTLVEVGRDRLKPEKIADILEAKDRCAAGPIAPAAGLCLMWIKY